MDKRFSLPALDPELDEENRERDENNQSVELGSGVRLVLCNEHQAGDREWLGAEEESEDCEQDAAHHEEVWGERVVHLPEVSAALLFESVQFLLDLLVARHVHGMGFC